MAAAQAPGHAAAGAEPVAMFHLHAVLVFPRYRACAVLDQEQEREFAMSVRVPSASFFRQGSARFLLCGALLCAALFAAHLPVLATVAGLLMVAVAGALRRLQEQKLAPSSRPHPALGNEREQAGTGLPDRQALEHKLRAESARVERPGDPTALLLISIDAFDQLQEPGSTMAAEVAMLTLSSALQRMLPRGADMLARYDESTFAVMLSGTDLPGSLRVAARLRWAVVRLGIANPRTVSGFLTVSMGVAVQQLLTGEEGRALLAAAESALAKARVTGHDSLDYVVLGGESNVAPLASQPSAQPSSSTLPAIRAWSPEQAPALYSPQS